MTTFTAADGQAAAERLATEQQAILESVLSLDGHVGRKLLDSGAVAGVTRERRADVLADLATLWVLYETYRAAVLRVHAIVAPRSCPDRAELREIEDLLSGAATVALPGTDGSLLGRQVTLDELVAEIHTVYSRVYEAVSAADQVWAELSPRIDGCDTLLREAGAHAAELGLPADQDPALVELAELAGRLATVRRLALTDPLRLWVDHAVDVADADQLISRCERLLVDLHALRELSQHAGRRLDQVDATLTEVRRLDEETVLERSRAKVKIRISPPSDPAVSPSDLHGPRFADAEQLRLRGDWRQLATELPALERDVDAALARARAELAGAGQPLRERAELRGRLSAYRAKAAGLGRIEDLALERRYQRAREELWRAPCDLGVAAAAVADYQDAVNRTSAPEDPA